MSPIWWATGNSTAREIFARRGGFLGLSAKSYKRVVNARLRYGGSKFLTFVEFWPPWRLFMHRAAVDLFQLLVQAGAMPGEDFSCDPEQQAYHLNQRCYDLLQAAYPDVDWLEILGDPYAGVDERIAALHQQLGHCFVDEILTGMTQRLASLPDDQAAGYVQAILVGVESATGIALYPFLMESFSLSEQARLEWLLRQEAVAIPGDLCLQDILQAAGATAEDYEVHAGEMWLTEAGWQRLALVWDGESTLHTSVQRQRSPKQP